MERIRQKIFIKGKKRHSYVMGAALITASNCKEKGKTVTA